MADETQAASQTTQEAADKTAASSSGGQQDAAQSQQSQEKTFTQAEFNRMLGERLKEERSKYADYDALKKKAEALESANKSELEKAQDRAAKAEADLKAAQSAAKRATLEANAKVKALELKFKPDRIDKVLKLLDLGEDATAETVSAQLDALAKEMPELLGGAPGTGASNPGKNEQQGETPAQRYARIRGGGTSYQDWLSGGSVVYSDPNRKT